MWQAPNAKTAKGGKRTGRERTRQPLHVKRVTAEIRLAGPNIDGDAAASARILLNDLSIKGVGVFSSQHFIAGQEVALVLSVPMQIYLRGKVVYSREAELNSHIITETPYTYRIGVKFVFENAAEEAAVRKFCEDILKSLYSDAA